MENPVTCIYHKDCIDGTAAAAVVFKKFPHAQCFPLSHAYTDEEIDTIFDLTPRSAHVYIVDASIGLEACLERGYHVTVIDHHISEHDRVLNIAKEHSSLTYIYDVQKSGASLTYSYFFPDEALPELIAYVEDKDLWLKKYGETTEHVTNYLSMFRNGPHDILDLLSVPISDIIKNGESITAYVHSEVGKSILIEPIRIMIGTHEVSAYNIPSHQSACGNVLSNTTGAAVALFKISGTDVHLSFRSQDGQYPSALVLASLIGEVGTKKHLVDACRYKSLFNR